MNKHTDHLKFVEFPYLARKGASAWENYRIWNSAICEHFFEGQYRGKPIYIDIDDAALSRIFGSAFGGEGDARACLRDAVCATVNKEDPANLFSEHVALATAWNRSHAESFPPFAAVLALFSLVAESMIADEDFAPNNYYGRLMSFLSLKVDEEDLIKSYRKATELLWPALNSWLSAYEGAIGYPTARPLDHRIYVSVAISQALVRNQDRLLLRRMFGDLGLASGQRVGYDEMEALLIHWVIAHAPGSSLARLINKTVEVRRRVAELACVELESWDGRSDRPQNQLGAAMLGVVAQMRLEPTPSLSLYFSTVAAFRSADEAPYKLDANTDDHTRAAFVAANGRYLMQRCDSPEIWSLEPWSSIRVSDALSSRVGFEALGEGDRKLFRNGSELLVLEYREKERLYREVAQASLMQRSLILVRDVAADKVADLLSRVARPGFTRFSGPGLKGLPSFWTAFSDVYITQPESHAGYEVLCPAGTRALIPSGGLLLSHQTWHSTAPPEILAADTTTSGELQVAINQTLQLSGASASQYQLGTFVGAGAFDLATVGLLDGDYEVQIAEKRVVLDRVSVRLRSSSNPRPWKLVPGPFQHQFSAERPLGILTAEVQEETNRDPGTTVVIGAEIVREHPILVTRCHNAASVSSALEADDAHFESDRAALGGGSEVHGSSCVARGYHVWGYDFVSPDAPRGQLVQATCSGCHQKLWQKVGGSKGRAARPIVVAPVRALNVAPVPTRSGLPNRFRSVFDALNHLRGGPFTQFKALCGYASDDAWAAVEHARLLSSLAHIDLQQDIRTLRPLQWRIGPSRIVMVSEGRAVLTGWRSPELVQALEAAVEPTAGSVIFEWWDDHLPIIRVDGLSQAELEQVVRRVAATTQEKVALSVDYAIKLLSCMPPVSRIVEHLPLVRPAREQVERFDVARARWVPSDDYRAVGAYRSRWRGQTYFFVSAEDVTERQGRSCGSRLGKHLASIANGSCLAEYDERERVIRFPLGCEPPWLYERALVMTSGVPPSRKGGRLEYCQVSPAFADGLIARLSC